jgi:hypothetical protein
VRKVVAAPEPAGPAAAVDAAIEGEAGHLTFPASSAAEGSRPITAADRAASATFGIRLPTAPAPPEPKGDEIEEGPPARKAAVRSLIDPESIPWQEEGPPAELAESDAIDADTYLRACPIRPHVKDKNAFDADAKAYLALLESGRLQEFRAAVRPLLAGAEGKRLGPALYLLRRVAEMKAPAEWRLSEDRPEGYTIIG